MISMLTWTMSMLLFVKIPIWNHSNNDNNTSTTAMIIARQRRTRQCLLPCRVNTSLNHLKQYEYPNEGIKTCLMSWTAWKLGQKRIILSPSPEAVERLILIVDRSPYDVMIPLLTRILFEFFFLFKCFNSSESTKIMGWIRITKATTKKILVVVVSWRHKENGPLSCIISLSCSLNYSIIL
jgi:hypothetical protein